VLWEVVKSDSRPYTFHIVGVESVISRAAEGAEKEKREERIVFPVPFDLEGEKKQQLLNAKQTLYHSMISASHEVSYSWPVSPISAIRHPANPVQPLSKHNQESAPL